MTSQQLITAGYPTSHPVEYPTPTTAALLEEARRDARRPQEPPIWIGEGPVDWIPAEVLDKITYRIRHIWGDETLRYTPL